MKLWNQRRQPCRAWSSATRSCKRTHFARLKQCKWSIDVAYSVFALPFIPFGLQVVFCSPLVCVNAECLWDRIGTWDGWVAWEVLYMKFDIFPGLGWLAIGTIYHFSHGSYFRPHYKSSPFRPKLMQFPFTWYTIAIWREMESSAISEMKSWFKNTAESRDKLWQIQSGLRRHGRFTVCDRFM